jgi:glyoxylase-like metal-dependent hydrolase (beta-lactamase superfamily II)
MSSATKIYGDQMDRLWGSVEDISSEKVISVDDKQIIRIGSLEFKALHTPGHASHHIAWVFNDVVFTGDVAGAKIQNGPVLPACPPPDIDLEKWEDSLKILEKENPKKMYLTHFGEHKNIRSHIDELREALSDWSLWINEKRKIFLDDEILTKNFNEYVYKKMQAAKINDELINQYYAANPPYMSVAGLKRYWEKNDK